jgi:NADH-quinone oxidoreductase subunit K
MYNKLIFNVGIEHFLLVSAILFLIGVAGILGNRRNLIAILFSIELMLLAVNMNFVIFSHFLGDLTGQLFVIFILTVAAAEVSIALAIIVVFFRHTNSIDIGQVSKLRG